MPNLNNNIEFRSGLPTFDHFHFQPLCLIFMVLKPILQLVWRFFYKLIELNLS